MTGQPDLFDLVEGIALARPDAVSDQPPQGLPAGELERILKWRASNKAAFNAKVQNGDVELSILGVIGSSWFSDGISARSVKNFLEQNKEAKNIRVLIDSPGGDYFDGAAIMNQLKRHSAKVVVEVIGEASSAASVIAMGADEVEMHAGSVMMVHRASSCMCGNGDELRTTASLLDKIDDALGDIYAARTGKKREAVNALVAATTYMSPREAVDHGFADREVPAKRKAAVAPGAVRAQANNLPATAPAPSAQQKAPTAGKEPKSMDQNTFVSTIAITLGLPPGSTESDITAAATRLRDLEKEAVALTGVQITAEALGALRGIKAQADRAKALETELVTVKTERDKQNFDTLVVNGKAERKLTPALITMYEVEFAEANAKGQGSEVVARLRGHIQAMAPIVPSRDVRPPAPGNGPSRGAELKWNGKTFDELTPVERHDLKNEAPETYDLMRRDWQASQ
jgi:ATP-dependent Clp protease, protease subunit